MEQRSKYWFLADVSHLRLVRRILSFTILPILGSSFCRAKLSILGLAVLVLLPVYRGITVYIMQRFDLEQFCQNIEQNKITLTFVVPPVVLLLAKHPLVDKYNLSSLRMMHSSAAPLTDDLVQMIYKRLKVPIKQGYGLSEASPGVAAQVF
jgi:4-coumarate--CoA ligase